MVLTLIAGRANAQNLATLTVPEICANPGETVITLPISLDNPTVVVRALNFTIQMSPGTELALTGVACTSRTLNYLCDAAQVGDNVNVIVVTTSSTATVLGTSGPVVELTFSDVSPTCTLDTHVALNITSATVADNSMPDPLPIPTTLVNGGFTCGCAATTSTTIGTSTTITTTSTSSSTTFSTSSSTSSTSSTSFVTTTSSSTSTSFSTTSTSTSFSTTTTSVSTTTSSTVTSTTSTSTSSTTSTSEQGATTTTSTSLTSTTSSSTTTSTSSSTSSSTTSTNTSSTTSTSEQGSTTTSTSSSSITSTTTSSSTTSSTVTSSTTSTTIPTGAACADVQARIQAEIGDGSQFETHGQLMRAVNALLRAEGETDRSCRSCIVRQFARGVPTAEQQPCGPSDSARAAFSVGIDQPLSAVKLLLKASETAEKALFLSKDTSIQPPVLNGPTDPTLFGASVELCSQAGHAFFDLPAQSWHANGTGSVFKYTRTGSGAEVKVALIKGGRTLKIVSKAVGLPLSGGMGPVGVRVSTGDVRNCALFTSETILKDEPGKYIAQSAIAGAIADCSDASLGCSSLP